MSQKIVRQLRDALGIRFLEGGAGDLKATFGPEDIFHYAYAVFHSPGYRSRYAEFLKIDFPRLPLTGNLELFRALARLGGELVTLHLLESPKLSAVAAAYDRRTPHGRSNTATVTDHRYNWTSPARKIPRSKKSRSPWREARRRFPEAPTLARPASRR